MRTPLLCCALFVLASVPPTGPAAGHASQRESPGAIHFAAVADQHYGWRTIPAPLHEGATFNDWMTHPDLPPLDFVIATLGDWISDHRQLEGWVEPEEVWQHVSLHSANRLAVPWYYVIGNHDLSNYGQLPVSGNPMLNEKLGRAVAGMNENCFAFGYNGVLFVGLGQTNVLYHLSGAQRDWLEYLTGTYHHLPTVILTHQAIHETTGQGNFQASSWTDDDYKIYNDTEWWQAFFAANPQVVLYLHGHNEKAWNTVAHDLHADRWDDTCTFVLVPGTGKDYGQDAWSYIFTIDESGLFIRLWDSEAHAFVESAEAGVPFSRPGPFAVTDSGMEWFSTSRFVLDGQQWRWRNRMLAAGYRLELIGTDTTELLDNPELDGCHEVDEVSGGWNGGYWYAVRGDEAALNLWTGEEDGRIRIAGGTVLELAASGARQNYVEGKVPYNTGAAVAGRSYTFTATLWTEEGTGRLDIMASIPKVDTLNKYIWRDQLLAEGLTVEPTPRTYRVTFTVPEAPGGWFIQPKLRLHDPGVVYLWDRWSLTMDAEGPVTADFAVTINGRPCQTPGPLAHLEAATFDCPPNWIGNRLEFDCAIGGNRTGLVRLVYLEPYLWSDDVSIGVCAADQSLVRLEDSAPYNDRTTLMSFDGDAPLLISPGFTRRDVRGKPLYTHAAADATLNGNYSIRHAPEISISTSTPQVPAGGSLSLDVTVTNNSSLPLALDVWSESEATGDEPLKGPFPLVLGPGASRRWPDLRQPLGQIPPGTWRYTIVAGQGPNGPRWAEATCDFEVVP